MRAPRAPLPHGWQSAPRRAHPAPLLPVPRNPRRRSGGPHRRSRAAPPRPPRAAEVAARVAVLQLRVAPGHRAAMCVCLAAQLRARSSFPCAPCHSCTLIACAVRSQPRCAVCKCNLVPLPELTARSEMPLPSLFFWFLLS